MLPLSEVTEWTLEANPATFDLEKAKLMRELGIDRISLGVQSFQQKTLKTLGRDHSRRDAIEAYETLREAGFENVSIDLMFSIPGQTREDWAADLQQAIELEPDHISAYNLTYEEDTEFLARHESGELDTDENRDADLFADAISRLTASGFGHYEISNYARPGFESLHNQAYWTGEDYLGLGPSAVSTLEGTRSTTIADTAAYVKAAKAGLDTRTDIEILSAEDLRIERIALQLRTREGIPVSLLPPAEEGKSNPVDSLVQQGMVRRVSDRIVLTEEGKALADPIAAALV
jgi:oxygen-independent coproporphyrinogen-3 oxidase